MHELCNTIQLGLLYLSSEILDLGKILFLKSAWLIVHLLVNTCIGTFPLKTALRIVYICTKCGNQLGTGVIDGRLDA